MEHRQLTQSIISRDLKIKGNLTCNGDIQIDGAVEGDVQSRSISIGEGADVRGTISSDSIRVCSSLNGQLTGHPVVLAKTARLICPRLWQSSPTSFSRVNADLPHEVVSTAMLA